MRGLAQHNLELIAFARKILAASHPMTLRQLHYAIFSAAKIAYANDEPDYKRLSRVTTVARRHYRTLELAGRADLLDSAALIPPEWIVDELRQSELVSMWSNLGSYLDAVRRSYRRDYWETQPNHVEIWCEKGAVLGSLRPVTEELGVRLRTCRGFGSTGMESDIGFLFQGIKKPIHILFAGDHDPSGYSIECDIHKRAQLASGREFRLERLAIHPTDLYTFNLQPQAVKENDSRVAQFRERFGEDAFTLELDALPVEELRSRVRAAIVELIDWPTWNMQASTEKVEFASITNIVERVKSLPQSNEDRIG